MPGLRPGFDSWGRSLNLSMFSSRRKEMCDLYFFLGLGVFLILCGLLLLVADRSDKKHEERMAVLGFEQHTEGTGEFSHTVWRKKS